MAMIGKKKRIMKRGEKGNYITFFRFHFPKLREAHPSWNSAQLSVIIGLMWQREKKRLETVKMTNKSSSEVHHARIPGRRLFRMAMKKN